MNLSTQESQSLAIPAKVDVDLSLISVTEGDRPTELALLVPWSRSEMASVGRVHSRCTLGPSARSAIASVLDCAGSDRAGDDSALQRPPPSDWLPATVQAEPG